MSVIDDLVAHNRSYAPEHGRHSLPTAPRLNLAVLTCMDSRLDLFGALGLTLGDAHLIRNAGGLATEDAVRSLLLSQFVLGTRSIMVIQHTRCSLEAFDEGALQIEIGKKFGRPTPFGLGAHNDLDANVQITVAILSSSPFIVSSEIRGFVFDVDTGDLREIATN